MVNFADKVFITRAGETVQWSTTVSALAEDPGSVFSTHMTAQNH